MPSTLRREDEIDKRADEMFNSHPDLQDSEKQAGSNYGAGTDQAEAYANDPNNSSQALGSRESTQGNDSANQFGYSRSDQSNSKSRRIKFLKKAGPTGGIIGLIIGGIFGLGVFISPSLAVVHIKEILTEDLDDQLGALDERSVHVFRAKLKDDLGKAGSGVTCTVKVRCDFKGMSDRQLKAFRAAGIDVETVGEKNVFGKTQVKALTFTSSSGKKTEVSKPTDINKLRIDKNIRNQLRRAYNPKFYGLRDAVAAKVFGKLRTSPSPKLKSSNVKEMDAEITDAVKGETLEVTSEKVSAGENDDDAKKQEIDDANNESSKITEGIEEAKERGGGVKGLFGSIGTGAAKGIGVLGAADSACSVYKTSLAVSALAKVKRAADLARFAMVFLNFADSVKARDATPEQAEYTGNKLSYTDTQKQVVDETSTFTGNDTDTAKKVDNPDYGKSAFDSQAMMAAQYNDAPNLTARSLSFAVGGGLSGRMDKINQNIASVLQTDVNGIRSKCNVVQNGFVRIGSFAGGIALGIVTLGGWTAVSIGASVGVSLAMPILQSYLADMIAGTVVSKDTKGVDAGNAIFSGSAVLLGSMAATRGMKPSSKEDLQKYQAFNNQVKQEYIAMEAEEDSKHPFDAGRQYSFLGKLTRSFVPASQTSNKFASMLGIFKAANNSLTSMTGAVGDFNSERFSKCKDENYKAIDIDADIMCNVRYSMSSEELKRDLEQTIDWMLAQKHIDEGGAAISESYSKWLEVCVNRTDGWGETSEEGGETGGICTDDSNEHSMFRTYTFDRTVIESMDYIPPKGGPGTGVMTFNILGLDQGDNNNNDGGLPIKQRSDAALNIVKEKQPQIIGFQEVNDEQFDMLRSGLSDYDSHPTTNKGALQPDSIFWSTASFTATERGTFDYPKRGSMSEAPWVKLQSTSGTGSVFVFNIHPATDQRWVNERKETANRLVKKINEVNTNNDPVVITGDFNSASYKRSIDDGISVSELPLSILKAAGYQNTLDIAAEKINDDYQSSHAKAGAPRDRDGRPDRQNKIDHVVVSTDITVNSWENVIDENSRIASDHTPIVATLSIPGISANPQQGLQTGGAIGGDDYRAECSQYKKYYAGICNKQCVSFVLFRLLKHKAIDSVVFGDGKEVVGALGKRGFAVSQKPTVNAVFSTSATSTPQWGHTGMVSKVNADGSIVIEEYNFNKPLAYGTRTMTKAEYTAKGYTFANTGTKYQ